MTTLYRVLILSFLLFGCDEEGVGNSNSNSIYSIATPRILTRALTGDCAANLAAQVVLGKNQNFKMAKEEGGWTATIKNLKPGEHQFGIDFSCTTDAYSKVLLAKAEKSFNLSAGNTEVSFNDDEYTLPDTDGDGLSNLVEFEQGSNPLVAKEDTDTSDAIVSTEPVAGSSSVARDAEINVVFTREVQASSLTPDTFFISSDGKKVRGTISYNAIEKKVTFRLEGSREWDILTVYTVTLTTGILDSVDTPLIGKDLTWQFVTRPGQWISQKIIGTGSQPRIASDGAGNAMTVWLDNSRIRANYFDHELNWQLSEAIAVADSVSMIEVSSPGIALSSAGEAVAIWEELGPPSKMTSSSIVSRRYFPTRSSEKWGAPQTLVGSVVQISGDSPRIAMDEGGNATAIWGSMRNPGRDNITDIYAIRTLPGSSSWSEPLLIEESENGVATDPQLIADQKGNVTVAWSEWQGGSDPTNILANRYTADTGSWGQTQVIEQNSKGFNEPQLSVDDAGNVHVVWRAGTELWSNRFDAQAQTWGKDQTLPAPGNTSLSDHKIVSDHNGNTTVISSRDKRISMLRLNASSGEWTSGSEASSGTREAEKPVIGIDGHGRVFAAWHESAGADESDILASYFDPSTSQWSTPHVLSQNGNKQHDLRIAVEPSGEAFMIWRDRNNDIVVRRYQ